MAIIEETDMKDALASLLFQSVGSCCHDDRPLIIFKAFYLGRAQDILVRTVVFPNPDH